ncbi:MAG: Uncharacterised protein [Acidimicrobiales bacterium AG-410-I20]|nr:MAG: Uncharacterised protein [Acidimicrobiales bacterium AG-410-I20]
MKEMESLFAVQEEDVVLRQLQHRKENLHEAGVVANTESRLAELSKSKDLLSAEHLETIQRQKRFEQEVEAVESRISELDGKLYGGMVTSPKEATSLETEIRHLRERQNELEEKILELMEEVEPQERGIEKVNNEIGETQKELEIAREALQVTSAELEETLKETHERREKAASETEAGLLKHYESLRGAFGSSVVVQFDGNNCKGCPSAMPAVEADRLKQIPEGSYSDCQECGRIVVR